MIIKVCEYKQEEKHELRIPHKRSLQCFNALKNASMQSKIPHSPITSLLHPFQIIPQESIIGSPSIQITMRQYSTIVQHTVPP